jgi:CheY-like chemotaxis protein
MSLSKARKLKILVVDDLLDAAQSLALLLAEMGYEAKFEIRPETVLERARALKPDADEDRKRTREAGFDAHVLKPMDIPLLEGILATVLLDPRQANALNA